MKVAMSLIALVLAACTMRVLDRGLQGLVGQHIQVAVNRLGIPDSHQNTLGGMVYTWADRGDFVEPTGTTSTVTGFVEGAPIYATTSTTEQRDVPISCTVRLVTNSAGIIERYRFSGDNWGCGQYALALRKG